MKAHKWNINLMALHRDSGNIMYGLRVLSDRELKHIVSYHKSVKKEFYKHSHYYKLKKYWTTP